MIKSVFFVVDTVLRGKKILYAYPDPDMNDIFENKDESQKYENLLNYQEAFLENFMKKVDFCKKL